MQVRPNYITAIAGMRALAVVSVVLYHLNATWLPGGFVGVDVFFVISGFVVAHSVMTVQKPSFGSYLAWFYRRRFRRIFPALFVYIIVVAVLGALFIPASESTKFIELTGASAVFGLSNFALLLKAGDYFSTVSEFNTFTHTWSLAIEEQYYFLFPFFSYPIIVGAARLSGLRRPAIIAVGVVCVTSLAASAFFTAHWQPFAFYMLPTRFWELGIGFSLRLFLEGRASAFPERVSVGIRSAVGVAALITLLASFIITDPQHFPFPGTVLPCLATAALLATFWNAPDGWVAKILSQRLPVYLGNISYSLYLWHWGVIVLMRWTVGLDSILLQGLAVALMLLLAAASYRFVEQRFQHDKRERPIGSPAFFAGFGAIAVVVAILCVGLYAVKPKIGLAASNNTVVWSPYQWAAAPGDPCTATRNAGTFAGGELFTFSSKCRSAAAPRLFVLGDSHAGAYQRMLWRLDASGRYDVQIYTLGGCRAIYVRDYPPVPGCKTFLQAAIDRIRTEDHPGDTVFLAGLQTPRFRDEWGNPQTKLQMIDTRPLSETASALENSRAEVAELASSGAQVLIEAPKPLVPTALYRCADWFNRGNAYCRVGWSVSRSQMAKRTDRPQRAIAWIVHGLPGVSIWDPGVTLCPGAICSGYRDGKPLYFDTDHLTGYANDLLYPDFVAHLSDRRRIRQSG